MKPHRSSIETAKARRSRGTEVGVVLVSALAFLAAGCLSPAVLRPVASQNSDNIGNYNANVAALANALMEEVRFHGEMEVEASRIRVSIALVQLPKQVFTPGDPNERDLADPSNPAHAYLRDKRVNVARVEWERLNIGEEQKGHLGARYPEAADIVLGTPGFSVTRVLNDAFELRRINAAVIAAGSDMVAANALRRQRDSLLDQYLPVRMTRELMESYQEALAEYISVVVEQGQVAAGHANSISAYANAEPRASTLATALQDEDLQGSVIALVEKKKGAERAARVHGYISKATDVLAIVERLRATR